MADSIKIVVRVRPFNANQQGQSSVVQMDDQQVRLKNPEDGQIKKFGFHRCYWSTDASQGKPPVNNMFVFNDIGQQILGHIYQGYNSTVFAYGQTGSGKSYSIEGYEEKGILQLCLQDIFQRKKKQNDTQGISTQVKVTYLEIYNQKLRDLLNPNQKNQIKVQSAGTAVFISGVDPVLCQSYDEVLKMFQDGKKIRVIGAHAMNKNSSRSHAVFTIYYKQVGKGKAIQAKFNIVDLAGSERQSKTGATGVRLQQANNINKSLTNLGIVIQTLANNCLKKKNDFVPYRNSLLTHILSESLCGNSKTFMIAAISPASSNYEQTLSTLRFAQRASLITTQSKKNVEQKQGYNKQLLQEIERLRKQLENAQGKVINTHTHSHSVDLQYITMEDQARVNDLQTKISIMLEELQKNKTAMEDLEKQLEEQRRKKQEMEENRKKALKEAGLQTQKDASKENLPYLMNISEDPTLAGMLIYHLKEGQISIGTSEAEENDIKLNALGIMKRHCTIVSKGGQIFITPKQDCRLYVNGLIVTDKKQIKHLDRITLGHANTFKLIIPGQKIDLLQAVARYGQFLDDRLNSESEQSKNTKIFLEQLEQRLDKDTFARFLDKFKNAFNDIDQANDYTNFRYKKYPLKNKNIQFRLNVILDIQNYTKGQPSLIILCEHKETKQIQFIWSQQKFQARLAEMQSWYADVGGNAQTQSTFYEFDPWFDATDHFIKEKQQLEVMNAKQIHQFWTKKQSENAEKYKNLLQEQKQILAKLSKQGANAELVEDYADYYFRGYDIPQKSKEKCEKLRKNEQLHKLSKRFMECCSQIQKCNLDNKAFNEAKSKYSNNHSKVSKDQNQGVDVEALTQQNLWLNLKIENLESEFRKKVKELDKQRKKNS